MPNIDQATSYLKIEKFFTQLHFKSVTTDRTSKLTSRIWNTNFKYNIGPSLQLKLTFCSVDYFFYYECKINSMYAKISSTENKNLLQIKVAASMTGANH